MIGVGGIGIGLVSSIIALNGRLVKLETNEQHHVERLRKLESKVFKDHDMRIGDIESGGRRKSVRMHRENDGTETA